MRSKRLILTGSIGLPILLVAVFFVMVNNLIAPSQIKIGCPPSHLPIESIVIESNSGSKLSGWFIPGTPNKGAVVLMHGIRSNRSSMLGRAELLHSIGYSVLMFDFQAHGESAGKIITCGHLERLDAQAAIRYIKARCPGKSVGVIGASLGGAASILSGKQLGADAVVLEGVFATVEEAISNRIGIRLGSIGATLLTPVILNALEWKVGVSSGALKPIETVSQIGAPILFIAGALDTRTPISESIKLYNTARNPKELWVVEDAAHVDFHAHASDEYRKRVLNFLERYLI